MARTPNIDTDKLKAQGLQLRDAAAVHAGPLSARARIFLPLRPLGKNPVLSPARIPFCRGRETRLVVTATFPAQRPLIEIV